jgi:hypothetical protein
MNDGSNRKLTERSDSEPPDWDRTHDWVLHRHWDDLTRVTIRFPTGKPSLAELVAVRHCLPQFRYLAPAAVQETIGDRGELSLGVLPTSEANSIVEGAREEGLEVVTADASFVSYLPEDRTDGCVWVIEDEAQSQAVAKSMLAAGIPVQDEEA